MGRQPAKLSPLEDGVIDKLMTKFESSGLTWDQLAERSGVPRTTAFKTLNKQRGSTVNEIVALAEALGLVAWKVVKDVEESLQPAPVIDLSERMARLRLERGAALDPGYDPEMEQGPESP